MASIKCQYCSREATNTVNLECSDGTTTLEVCDLCYLQLAEVLVEADAKLKEKD